MSFSYFSPVIHNFSLIFHHGKKTYSIQQTFVNPCDIQDACVLTCKNWYCRNHRLPLTDDF